MRRYKKEDAFSYALGAAPTIELLLNKPKQAVFVYFHSSFRQGEAFDKLTLLCKENNIEPVRSDKPFTVLSGKENCFVIGVFKKFESPLEKSENHIVLVNPSNMGNLGTIVRTAAGFHVRDLALVRPAADLFDPRTVRSSMGAVFRIRFQYFDSYADYVAAAGQRQIYPFILQGKSPLEQVEKRAPFSLVFGNEASGLPEEFSRMESTVVIRHGREIDSLNLDNAVSIALYEFTKGLF